MTDATSIANRYIALWNETNADRRQALMAVQQRLPAFRFALIGQPDGYGDNVRFSWQLGPEGADGPIKGTDFASLDNGRLKEVVGFLDQVPAAV